MAFTYGGDPANSNLEAVRYLIGDTVITDVQLQDAEINFNLAEAGNNIYLAGSSAALAIASKYAKLVDKEVGDLMIDYSQRQAHYINLSRELSRQASKKSTPNIFAGGLSLSDKESNQENTDTVQPTFERDMFTNKGIGEIRDAC